MAGPRPSGTPRDDRARGYVYPSRSRRVVWVSLAGGIVVIGALTAMYVGGFRRAFSPGPLAAHHARMDVKCVQCHQPGSTVAELRCERCHDPAQSTRMTEAAHERWGSGTGPAADHADGVPCATCHRDHLGREFVMQRVDDRECSRCHRSIPSLARHPEFNVVAMRLVADTGIKFNHDRHVAGGQSPYKEVAARGTTCVSCHEQTGDRRVFQPMTFERHCAACHGDGRFVNGETEKLAADLVVLPDQLSPYWLAQGRPTITDVPVGPNVRKQATRLLHKDGWAIANALRLREGIDAEGAATERLALESRIAYLDQFKFLTPSDRLSVAELPGAIEAVRSDLARLEAQLARNAPGRSESDLRALVDATRAVADQLQGVNADIDPQLLDLIEMSVAFSSAAAPSGTPPARPDRRVQELSALLDAIDARAKAANDDGLSARVPAYRERLQRLGSAATPGAVATSEALQQQVAALDRLVQSLSKTVNPRDQTHLVGLDYLSRYAQQQIAGGLPIADVQSGQIQLLKLLDGIDARADEAVRVRVAQLRARVIGLRPEPAADSIRRARDDQRRLLDRLLLEQELRRTSDIEEAPSGQAFATDREQAAKLAAPLRAQLTDLMQAPRLRPAADADERDRYMSALTGLLQPCLVCHKFDPSGSRLAPVRADQPVMSRSVFNHAPHVTAASKCEDCHASALTSKTATEPLVPAVAKCQTCHRPSQNRSDCAECHMYHPSSISRLMR